MPDLAWAELERLVGEDERSIDSLYESWWSGRPSISDEDPDVPGTSYHPAEKWKMLSNSGNGVLTIARDGEVAAVSEGEWLAAGEDELLVRRRRHWVKGGFLWATSRRCTPLTANRWRVRVYVPGAFGGSVQEFGMLARALDRAGYWYEGKVRLGGACHSDQCVFWLAAGDAVNAYEQFGIRINSESGRVEPPPFTLRLGAVGVAHDPEGSRSLGLAVCGAVVAARDQEPALDLQHRWGRACEAYRLRADRPWRHPGTIDPFGVWSELEKLAC